jgi:hypothetical protein
MFFLSLPGEFAASCPMQRRQWRLLIDRQAFSSSRAGAACGDQPNLREIDSAARTIAGAKLLARDTLKR